MRKSPLERHTALSEGKSIDSEYKLPVSKPLCPDFTQNPCPENGCAQPLLNLVPKSRQRTTSKLSNTNIGWLVVDWIYSTCGQIIPPQHTCQLSPWHLKPIHHFQPTPNKPQPKTASLHYQHLKPRQTTFSEYSSRESEESCKPLLLKRQKRRLKRALLALHPPRVIVNDLVDANQVRSASRLSALDSTFITSSLCRWLRVTKTSLAEPLGLQAEANHLARIGPERRVQQLTGKTT